MTFEEWKEKHSDLIENVAITFFNYGRGVDTKTCYDELEYLCKKAFNAGKPKWHNVADGDLPNKELEEKQLLVRVRNYTEDFIFAYYMLDKYYSKNGKRFYFDIDCDSPINTKDIIAWKEIVFPKEIKEND